MLHKEFSSSEGFSTLGTYIAAGLGVLNAVSQEMQPPQEAAPTLAAVQAAAAVPVAVGDGERGLLGNGAALPAGVRAFGTPACAQTLLGLLALGFGDPHDDGGMLGRRLSFADHSGGRPGRFCLPSQGTGCSGVGCYRRRSGSSVHAMLEHTLDRSLWFGFALVRRGLNISHEVGHMPV